MGNCLGGGGAGGAGAVSTTTTNATKTRPNKSSKAFQGTVRILCRIIEKTTSCEQKKKQNYSGTICDFWVGEEGELVICKFHHFLLHTALFDFPSPPSTI